MILSSFQNKSLMHHLSNFSFWLPVDLANCVTGKLPLTDWSVYLWPRRSWKWVQMDGKVPLDQILLCPQTSW